MLCELWLTTALAQQPIEAFLSASVDHAVENRLAGAAQAGAAARRGEALGGWLPRVSAGAGYTRNQFPVEATFPSADGGLETVTITAQDQLDANVRIDVPLFDLPAWTRWAAANAELSATRERTAIAERSTTLAVTRAWYGLVSARAVERAANAALETALATEQHVADRLAAGLASPLDDERSDADVARAREAVATAALDVALATRDLIVLTGLEPDDQVIELEIGSGEDAPLEAWMARAERTPELIAARADLQAARSRRAAAGTGLLPRVDGFATERWTNAAGFGPNASWAAGVQATWNLDVGRSAAIASANSAVVQARESERGARDQVATSLYVAWHQVQAAAARVEATQQAEAALTRATAVARSRFDAGLADQLDVSTAERDRFQAEVDHLRARAELAIQRLTLRIRAGLPPDPAVGP